MMIGQDINKAKLFLDKGKVIGLPTETVYGLAANAYDRSAVETIFRVKNRPLTSPLIVHTNDFSRVHCFVKDMPAEALLLAKTFWPGPLTLLLEKLPIIPPIVTAGLPRVGVRIPRHPLALELLSKLSFPLAAPSANLFSCISPTTAYHVANQLGDQLPYILDGGPCQEGLESTIVGFQHGKPIIYRLGSITQEEIAGVVSNVVYCPPKSGEKELSISPGRISHHYAPRTPICRGDILSLLRRYKDKRLVALCFDRPIKALPDERQIVLSPKKSLKEAARSFFAALHYLDTLRAELIIAPIFPERGLGKTLNERLQRASSTFALF